MAEESDLEKTEDPSPRRLEQAREEGQVPQSRELSTFLVTVTGAAAPAQRGTFMALNSAVQSAAMGLASFVGGLIIGRDAGGLVTHYWVSALVGAVASVLAVLLVRRVQVHATAGVQRQPA